MDCQQYRGCARCKPGYYGGQCEQTCTNCMNGDCVQSNGFCRQGCKDGYKGLACQAGNKIVEVID